MIWVCSDLLEKNRVVHQGAAERNYHIFYQLLYASDDEALQKLCLLSRKPEDYAYLAEGVPSVDAIDDNQEYKDTVVSIKKRTRGERVVDSTKKINFWRVLMSEFSGKLRGIIFEKKQINNAKPLSN